MSGCGREEVVDYTERRHHCGSSIGGPHRLAAVAAAADLACIGQRRDTVREGPGHIGAGRRLETTWSVGDGVCEVAARRGEERRGEKLNRAVGAEGLQIQLSCVSASDASRHRTRRGGS